MAGCRPADFGAEAVFSPVADVYEVEGTFVIRLAVPGVLEEDIDISFGPEGLTVRGELERPVAAEVVERGGGRAIVTEWRYGYFERRIDLPGAFDAEHLHVEVEAGVLEIRVPKG
jgi:HSP20 family molecular chaperone IbpA